MTCDTVYIILTAKLTTDHLTANLVTLFDSFFFFLDLAFLFHNKQTSTKMQRATRAQCLRHIYKRKEYGVGKVN